MAESETEGTGSLIKRGGGHLIRVGWRAAGYSVDASIATRYKLYTALLFLLALAVGVATVYGASFVFYSFAVPLASKVTPFFKNYPDLFQLLIYGSTLVFGGLIYWHIRALVGMRLVNGAPKLHDGFSLLEQRRRGSARRKRVRIPLLVLILALGFAPLGLERSLQVFLVLIPLFFLLEGIVFQLWKPKA